MFQLTKHKHIYTHTYTLSYTEKPSYQLCVRKDRHEGYQNGFPKQQQHFLHGEVGGVATAELGYHGEEHYRNWLTVIQ